MAEKEQARIKKADIVCLECNRTMKADADSDGYTHCGWCGKPLAQIPKA